jgi:hypothetical protein
MNDTAIVFVSLALIVAVPFDAYVALRLVRAAILRPRIPALTAMAIVSSAIFIAALIFGVLGLNAIILLRTGQRIIPMVASTTLLVIAVCVISLPNAHLLRRLRVWDQQARTFRIHGRSGETKIMPHRRDGDPLPDERP